MREVQEGMMEKLSTEAQFEWRAGAFKSETGVRGGGRIQIP